MTVPRLAVSAITATKSGVARFAERTPVRPDRLLSSRIGAPVGLKLESIQPTGSFKIRGAAAKLTSLDPAVADRGVITASTGNHGRAVAHVARAMGIPATICLSDNVPADKVSALRSLGCELDIGGPSQDVAFDRAIAAADAPNGPTLVHSILDLTVLAGQGTCGLEIVEQVPDVGLVIVPVSGGGLIAGIASAVCGLRSRVRVVGVSMDRGAVMHASLAAGQPVQLPEFETLADSLQGGLGPGNDTTFPIVQDLVEEVVLVTEEQIAAGMRHVLGEHRLVLEGAGAVGVAAVLNDLIVPPTDGSVVVVCSGSNAEATTIATLAQQLAANSNGSNRQDERTRPTKDLMTRTEFYDDISTTLDGIRDEGLWKHERQIESPQGPTVTVADADDVMNLCANNYLGLADHPAIVAAAGAAMEVYGYGMASVRFICGTLDVHRHLERELADYLGTDDSVLFAACFDANGGVFEALLGAEDAVVSDSLNHASIIDGVRLCKAQRYRYATRDLDDLDRQLTDARAAGARHVLVVTDGVFSMDGYIADVAGICDVADRHGALVMVDDAHATGLVGPEGRGTPALHGVADRVDLVTSTLGKALGGGMGGFIAARQPVVDLLRQRARPYLFSNSLAPALVGGARAAISIAREGDDRRAQLERNAGRFREAMTQAGFELSGAGHPIIPVMIGDATRAGAMAARLLELGVYVTAFSYPVVPHDTARIRTQMNAAHTDDDIDRAVAAFTRAGTELDLVVGPR